MCVILLGIPLFDQPMLPVIGRNSSTAVNLAPLRSHGTRRLPQISTCEVHNTLYGALASR